MVVSGIIAAVAIALLIWFARRAGRTRPPRRRWATARRTKSIGQRY